MKTDLLSSGSRSQWRLIWLDMILPYLLSCWSFCNQIWTDGTSLLGIFGVKLDCCLQGQGHSDGSKIYWIFMSLSWWNVCLKHLHYVLFVWIKKIWNRVDCQRYEKKKRTQAHKRLKERFLIRRNRTKRADFRGIPLFQATYNNTTENS